MEECVQMRVHTNTLYSIYKMEMAQRQRHTHTSSGSHAISAGKDNQKVERYNEMMTMLRRYSYLHTQTHMIPKHFSSGVKFCASFIR